jgi:hypothetical protein
MDEPVHAAAGNGVGQHLMAEPFDLFQQQVAATLDFPVSSFI